LSLSTKVTLKSTIGVYPSPTAPDLADFYRQRGRDIEGESVLRSAIATSPQDAGLHHALGLALTRLKRPADALKELRRAAELEPERARYAYVYAIWLHSSGRATDATTVLKPFSRRAWRGIQPTP
jgi:Flp pilus assembly protein TadD